MKVLSTNVGEPKEFHFQGRTIHSSMHRPPMPEGIRVHFGRVEGDRFDADKIHGVREVAVYALSSDFYTRFSQQIERPVGPGVFGENLTMDELDETQIFVGDQYKIGSCRLQVTAPRSPCNRLNFAFQSPKAQELFIEFARPGVYFEVLQEGEVKPGDELLRVQASGAPYSIADAFELWRLSREISAGRADIAQAQDKFRQLVADERVPAFLRARFRKLAGHV